MQAYTIDAFRTHGSVRDLPLPEPARNEVRVRITAAGVNPVDWKLRGGMNPSLPLPRVLGQDFAGIVDAAGDAATRLPVGSRVVGCARTHGAYAQYTTIPVDAPGEPVALLPDDVDDAVAAALPTPGLTALGCLNAAGVGAGTAVAIVGAAGAVGSIATQLAALRGAHVIAAVRSGEEAAARIFGAERTIDSSRLIDELRALQADYPAGIAAVIDLVNDGETLKSFPAVIAPGATIVTTIHVADEAWFAERGFRAVNLVMNQTPESSPAGLDELTGLVKAGKLTVALGPQRPLTEAGDILDAGEQHTLRGKAILRP